MSVKDDAAKFLSSPDESAKLAISWLNFTIDTITIDPEGYAEIGRKIASGGIGVDSPVANADSPIAEAYTPALDRLSLRPNLKLLGRDASVMDQAGVIHEATHALIDFHGYQTTNGVEEAVAYLAQVVFSKYRSQVFGSQDAKGQAILDAAESLVRSRRLLVKKNVRMSSTDEDVKALVDAVKGHSAAYPDADQENHANGVFGGSQSKYKSAGFGKK